MTFTSQNKAGAVAIAQSAMKARALKTTIHSSLKLMTQLLVHI